MFLILAVPGGTPRCFVHDRNARKRSLNRVDMLYSQ